MSVLPHEQQPLLPLFSSLLPRPPQQSNGPLHCHVEPALDSSASVTCKHDLNHQQELPISHNCESEEEEKEIAGSVGVEERGIRCRGRGEKGDDVGDYWSGHSLQRILGFDRIMTAFFKNASAVAWEAGKPLVMEEVEVAPPQKDEVRKNTVHLPLPP
ncbi:Alcohol dehydrogenase 3-like protein [Drosera capensis]